MKFHTSSTLIGKISAILGTIFVIMGAGMLAFAGLTGLIFLPLTFAGIILILVGVYLARSLRLTELINDFLR